MVTRVVFAVPGDLATPTGGYAYDRRIIAELRKLGWQVDIVDLGEGFPRPGDDGKSRARATLMGLPQACPVVVDGLALGVLPEAAQELSARNPLVALVHHPLGYEAGLTSAQSAALVALERAALRFAAHIIVTSAPTRDTLVSDFAVEADAPRFEPYYAMFHADGGPDSQFALFRPFA